MNELKIGDTIKCKNFTDMYKVLNELQKEGIITTIRKNYTLLIVDIMKGESEL